MRYTDDSLYPENMAPLIVTAASRSRRRWIATTPAPPSCTSTCANLATGHLSADIDHYNYMLERLQAHQNPLDAFRTTRGSLSFCAWRRSSSSFEMAVLFPFANVGRISPIITHCAALTPKLRHFLQPALLRACEKAPLSVNRRGFVIDDSRKSVLETELVHNFILRRLQLSILYGTF